VPLDGRADVYSLGCVLYECLTGNVPFSRDSRLAVAWAHLEEEPPSASEHNPDLPEAIDPVIVKAMAKSPEERYPTCAALIAAAEEALGLREPPIFRRGRVLLLGAAAIVVLVVAAVAAALGIRGTRDASVPAPTVRLNTLVRIDPARNEVSEVVDIGPQPSATAVGGRSVWVYNHGGGTVSEIDPATNDVRQTIALSARPVDLSLLAGPVLDADEAGAWLVGVDGGGDGFLTRVLRGNGGKREYRVDVEPKAVAIGEGAVWLLGVGSRGNQVLRVDPATGGVTARVRFPASAQIDSLTLGPQAVWVVASSSATLYRIDPRSAKVTGHRDIGERAGRPNFRFGYVWVGVSDGGGDTVLVDARTLMIVAHLGCCALDVGSNASGYGSIWMADSQTGEVVRFDGETKQIVDTIAVTDAPAWGGPCMTSIAAGAGGVWVTAAPAYACPG